MGDQAGAAVALEQLQRLARGLPELAAVAHVLEVMAQRIGNPAYAAALLAPPGGRPEFDDKAALAEMGWLLDSDYAETAEEAARMIAAARPREQSSAATTARLARKYRKMSRIKPVK
jgi:hypothetical protein